MHSTSGSVQELGTRPELCPRSGRSGRDLIIDISLKAQLRGIQNVFQTDNQNFGVRAELSPTGKFAFLISRGGSNSFTALPLPKELRSGEFKKVTLRLRKNGTATLSTPSGPTITKRFLLPTSCGNVRIGTGYDNDRRFLGQATLVFTTETVQRPYSVTLSWTYIIITAGYMLVALASPLRKVSALPKDGN